MSALVRASRLAALARQTAPTTRTTLVRFLSASYPADRKYKNSHEWVKVDGDIATVGITDHAQSALGEIVFADLPEIGSTVEAAQSTAAVESVKAVSDVYSPIAGEIVQVNDKLEDTPNLINEKPHDDGWMFQVKLTNPGDYDALMDSDSYTKSLEESK